MKVVLVLLLAAVGCLAQVKQYPTKYDNIDVKSILNNRILLTRYINCMLDKVRCDNDGKTLKELLPDALMTGCERCSPKQKQSSKEVIIHLMKNRAPEWKLLLDKYDPSGKYEHNYKGLIL